MKLSRRDFAQLSAALLAVGPVYGSRAAPGSDAPLEEFGYGDVTLDSAAHQAQLENTHQVLMSLSEDSLLRPFRQMLGQAAPGADLGGWYNYDPDFDWHKDDAGFAPGATFGQWVSALARYYAITGSQETREKVLRLNSLYARSIGGGFYDKNRFPAYCFDKLLLGLIDAHQFAADPQALKYLDATTEAALPYLPAAAIDRELPWRPGKDQSYRWDESYTNPENLFLAFRRGAGTRYRDLAVRFLDDASWFDPLARDENVLAGKHAYSYVNSLSSAMQAYLTLGSVRHLHAASNAFTMLSAQSYPTGGWGPDEKLVTPGSAQLHASLSSTHNSFETPCGAYAHFKLTRYLLRVTRNPLYGDSMERVMYNTVLGAREMHADGRAFYYSDYSFSARKAFSNHRFPCCSGTLPQVATDYGINSYLRDARGVYVNLYVPSRLRWQQQGARCSLQQSGDYPFDEHIAVRIRTSGPQRFVVRLRIPAWAAGARVEINGMRAPIAPEPGTFMSLDRTWHDDDRIDLQLPRALRLEPVDAQHPDVVALLSGPLVLFADISGGVPTPQRTQLLAARQVSRQSWAVQLGSRTQPLVPFTAIDAQPYTAFMNLAG